MNFHEQMTIINDSISIEVGENSRWKFIAPEKWRKMMIKILTKLRKKQIYDEYLVDDLTTIVSKVPESSFVEAVIHIQPFKPNFMRKTSKISSLRTSNSSQKQNYDSEGRSQQKRSKNSNHSKQIWLSNIFKFKHEIHIKVRDSIYEIGELNYSNSLIDATIALITQQQTLFKEFEAPYHPFRKVIDKMVLLLEHKYKNYISSQSHPDIESIQEMLLLDLNLLQQFIIKASFPYLQIFKSRNKAERIEFQVQLIAFIKRYVEKHRKINALIKKIMKFALKKQQKIEKLVQNLPNVTEIDSFYIEQRFKINGEYSYALHSLIEFSQSQNSAESLKKLQQLRENILKDIDLYNQQPNVRQQPISLKLAVETQLQIIKFLLCKAKIFLVDMLTQLKYLEVVLGENDISYKYDDSSFMYAQLMVAVDILMLEHA